MSPEPSLTLAQRRLRLASQIRDRRHWGNLTQEGLSEQAGVSVHTIQRIESGRHETKISHLWHIADALGCPVADLLQ